MHFTDANFFHDNIIYFTASKRKFGILKSILIMLVDKVDLERPLWLDNAMTDPSYFAPEPSTIQLIFMNDLSGKQMLLIRIVRFTFVRIYHSHLISLTWMAYIVFCQHDCISVICQVGRFS